MKQKFFLILLLALTACAPPPPTLVPFETVVAETMAAIIGPPTPTPLPTDVPLPTATETAAPESTPTASFPMDAAGAACVPPDGERVDARVSRVVDGDTIEVAIGNSLYQVRYLGINAPSASAPMEWGGPESAAMNKALVSSQIVTLVRETTDMDQNGRLLRYVFVGRVFVNYELVRQGFAYAEPLAPDISCRETFAIAAEEARGVMIGVWAATPFPTLTLAPPFTATPIGGIPTSTPTKPPPCNCNESKFTCNDFTTRAAAQACYDYCKNRGFLEKVAGLDKNGNGRTCEGLP